MLPSASGAVSVFGDAPGARLEVPVGFGSGTSCLVTGAAGFIGSHLVEELVRRGARVRAFVHYGSDRDVGNLAFLPPEILRNVEVVSGDILDVETVSQVCAGVDLVFHLAALVGIPYSYRSPRDVVETNVIGTLNVLAAARLHEVQRLVQTSTSEVYGTAQTVPIDESHPLVGQSPYAASKIGSDQLAISFHRSFGLPVSLVRPFNTYGPRQSARAIIPTIISQALAGSSIRLGSVTPTRDFNYVTDTAAGFIAVAASDTTIGGTFNIGTGTETSVGAVVALVSEIVGRELVVVADPQRVRPATSEVDRLVADASLLRSATGWAPMVDLPDGLRRTADWISVHAARLAPDIYAV